MEFFLEKINLPDGLTVEIFRKTIEQSVYVNDEVVTRSKWRFGSYYFEEYYEPYDAIIHAMFSANEIDRCFVHNNRIYKIVENSSNPSKIRVRKNRFITLNSYSRKDMKFSVESGLLKRLTGNKYRFEKVLRSHNGSNTNSKRKYGLLLYYNFEEDELLYRWYDQRYYDTMKSALQAREYYMTNETEPSKVIIFHNDPDQHVSEKFFVKTLI